MERFRIGLGEDSHRLAPGGPLRLGGVELPHAKHLVGHSDADVLLHAITDALLGAAALPDIGELFPNSDEALRGCDSAEILRAAWRRVASAGYRIVNLDCVLLLERPRFAPHKQAVCRRIAEILGIAPDAVNCKAKTGEGVGSIGREEAVAARCVALLEFHSADTPTMTTAANADRQQVELSPPHPTLHIYNSLTRRKHPFRTVRPGKVGIYLCGPTVYDKAHIGHMVGPVIFDCIKRYLAYCGYEVTWVVNITDVDDKLIHKARERGISMLEVAEENIADYRHNLAALGVDQIDHFPRATDCMPGIVALIEKLIDRGFAYAADGDVYFDVARDPQYGKLSNRSIDAVQGDGGEGADRKRSAADFALWKGAKPGEPSWDSPWGPGRPGWHIECSAMSRQLLGETFDIHGGGLDLVFPHHENEIAQSECCHGKPMVSYWAHNGLLRRDPAAGKIGGRQEREAATAPDDAAGGKMSRSKGAGGLARLIAGQGGERIRFFLLRTHYRSTVLFSEEAVREAGAGLETFFRLFKRYARIAGDDFHRLSAPADREAAEQQARRARDSGDPTLAAALTCRERFLAAMDDDFNTGGAIGELFELARLINKFCDEHQLEAARPSPERVAELTRLMSVLRELSGVLGLFLQPPADAPRGQSDALAGALQVLLDLRSQARAARQFAVADAIRDGLAPLGIAIEDRPGGAEWSGGGDDALAGAMRLLLDLRQAARGRKDFAAADAIRDRLAEAGIVVEDRSAGAEWTVKS
jgi:cysteinyl-tRNA synthetase